MRPRVFWALSCAASALVLASACGLELGGPGDADSGPDSGAPGDGSANDQTAPPDGPSDAMDFDIPDLGTGETETGAPCTCVPPIPNGYTVVAYDAVARPSCPPDYGMQKDLVENPTAAASTCTCSCNATPGQQPACACGANPATFNLTFDNSSACNGAQDTAAASAAPGCNNAAKSYSSTGNGLDYVKAVPAAACTPSGGTCSVPTKTTTFPQVNVSQGRSCTLTGATTSCMSGVCVPVPTAGYDVCVTKGTLDPCPVDFPKDHLAGTSVDDTRSCGPSACTCAIGGTTCGVPQLSFFDKNNCGGNDLLVTIAADGTCKPVNWGNNRATSSTRYASTPSGATCSFGGTFTPQGGLGVKSGARICCR